MAVKLQYHPPSKGNLVLAGYEGGLTSVHLLPSGASSSVRPAQLLYLSQPHTQPILSLDVSSDATTYFTSSADAIIAAHRIPASPLVTDQSRQRASKEASGLEAGSDASEASGPIEELTTKSSISPPAPSNHIINTNERGESASTSQTSPLSFAKRPVPPSQPTSAGLSSLLSSAPSQPKIKPQPPNPPPVTLRPPYKITNTKHAGQQSLRVRSDGRILVTGGWDSRIRIYSTKTLKEVAVLKWHKEGVYAVDFAEVLEAGDLLHDEAEGSEVAKRETGLGKLQRQREEQMQLKNWVVAGAKDGKVSLWEVF